ncbi:IMPACT family protein [Specibacter sp. RAF43]|uniref:IMPACT family protein n=1 Tax=Specibacter sp. RAF43 TaxID=3233057 RepID=UPI003F9500B9
MTGNQTSATSYLTVDGSHRHELDVKRSRFITYLRRVESEEAARDVVAELRKTHFDARHHCSAYIVGPDRTLRRGNDDGEPAGTAGVPMLEALAQRETAPGRHELSDVIAVTVRYFGGILLGAGGLVRAYSDSVSSALDQTPLVRRNRLRRFTVAVPHATAGRLEHELRAAGYVMTGNAYDARDTRVGLAMADHPGTIAAARDRLASLTAGAGELVDAGAEWVDVH